MLRNRLKHALQIIVNVRVPESENGQFLVLQELLADSVSRFSPNVALSVKLDHCSMRAGVEVNDVRSDRLLAAKLDSAELVAS